MCSMMVPSDKLGPADRLLGIQDCVWIEFRQLVVEHGALDLGEGLLDFAAPGHVIDALAAAAASKDVMLHQYTRGFGHPRLTAVLSTLYSALIGRTVDPQRELLVTVGAYDALFCALLAHVNPGEEVIVIEPFYDCYASIVQMCSGVPVYVPLKPNPAKRTSSSDWTLDSDELAAKFTPKTKAIIVNNPHNPTGKVFAKSELEAIAELCKKHDVLVVMDEVFEWLVYEEHRHVRMASLPGMWDRTLTVGSAGKTFSVTGWKLGWVYGSERLVRNVQLVHQNCVYTCPTPIQEAVATCFELELPRLDREECYFNVLATRLKAKRDLIVRCLRDAGLEPVVPDSGYFVIADYSKIAGNVAFDSESGGAKDYRFAKWLLKEKKLCTIPPSTFYSPQHKHLAGDYIRFCFIKEDGNLTKAGEILKTLKTSACET